MRIWGMLGIIAITLVYYSCRTPMADVRPWLDTVKGAPKINIEGQWDCAEWGPAVFIQKDRTVTGSIGSYTVEGVVSGDTAYLLIGYGGTFYYYTVLKPHKELLMGRYVYKKPDKMEMPEKDAIPIVLKKSK